MSLIPEEQLNQPRNLNLAPMVDFLFLILAVFAVMIVSRTMLFDSEIQTVKMETKTPLPSLAEAPGGHTILLSIDSHGQFKWVTEFNEFLLDGIEAITKELHKQQALGYLPKDKSKIKVLLQIDHNTEWHHVAKAIYSLKEAGFSISPVYEPVRS